MRRYLIVGVALAIGTGLTVWASLINFGSREINIVVALVIASAKGFLVAGFFMHLISEKKMIYAVLAFTGFLFHRVDVSYFVVHGARQHHSYPFSIACH